MARLRIWESWRKIRLGKRRLISIYIGRWSHIHRCLVFWGIFGWLETRLNIRQVYVVLSSSRDRKLLCLFFNNIILLLFFGFDELWIIFLHIKSLVVRVSEIFNKSLLIKFLINSTIVQVWHVDCWQKLTVAQNLLFGLLLL